MKRTRTVLTLVGLALLLAACQDPAPGFTFKGTTTAAGVEQPLTLDYEQRGHRLTGAYHVRAVTGTFRGTLVDSIVAAELQPAPDCIYSFEGTLEGTTLTGAYEPTDCVGGQAGTWALELQ